MYYIYIIYSTKLDRYYVGYTADINKRLVDHVIQASLHLLQKLLTGQSAIPKILLQESWRTKGNLKSKKRKAGNILNG